MTNNGKEANDHGAFATQHVPPAPGPEIPIERVRANDRKDYVVLSPSLWGVWTHWCGDRSEPCFAEKAQCPGCKRGLPRRWKGYLHVFNRATNREAFAELTPLSAENLLSQIGDAPTMRGLKLTLKRTSAKNGRLLVLLDPGLAHVPADRVARDPVAVLSKLWGVTMSRGTFGRNGAGGLFPDAGAQSA